MSLFSIVQGRTPPPLPAVPDAGVAAPPPAQAPVAQSPFPPMPAPASAAGYLYGGQEDFGRPVSGYMHGGMEHLGFEADYAPMYMENDSDASTDRYVADGVMNIPGYVDPPKPGAGGANITFAPVDHGTGWTPGGYGGSGSNTFVDSFSQAPVANGQEGRILAARAAYFKDSGKVLNDQEAVSYADFLDSQKAQDRADALALRGGGSGPDHFYEQLAYNTQKDAATRADMQRQADAQQQALQQKAVADWHTTQAQIEQARQNNITSAGDAANSAFLAAANVADPNAAPRTFMPWSYANQAAAAPTNAAVSDQNMPNIPGYVFNNPNGGQ